LESWAPEINKGGQGSCVVTKRTKHSTMRDGLRNLGSRCLESSRFRFRLGIFYTVEENKVRVSATCREKEEIYGENWGIFCTKSVSPPNACSYVDSVIFENRLDIPWNKKDFLFVPSSYA